VTDPRRTPAERAQARARNNAHHEWVRERADRPAEAIDQLWRQAGGGTSRFSPAVFSGLVQSERWNAVDPCGSAACKGTPPHLCWWSALGASVMDLRRKRPAAKPTTATTLF
jgi:hypothetical protein